MKMVIYVIGVEMMVYIREK